MQALSSIFYFIVVIGILVFVHELGHFLAARLFGMRAEKFYIGFDFFSLRFWRKQVGETEYGVGAFPLGGYVKIAGMVDESFDTEFVNTPPQPWEFRAKPIWQRLIVMSAGVLMNVLLAVAIFWGIIYQRGTYVRPITEIGYVKSSSPAGRAGFQKGDKIVSINNVKTESWEDVVTVMYAEAAGEDLEFQVIRAGQLASLRVTRKNIPDFSDEAFGFHPSQLLGVVGAVQPGLPAAAIGLQSGDTIVSINRVSVVAGEIPETVHKNARREIVLGWKRNGVEMEFAVTPNDSGRIGIEILSAYVGPTEHRQYSLFEALPIGATEIWDNTRLFYKNILQIFRGKVEFSKSVGGPIKIAQLATRSAEGGIGPFLGFTAMLSMSLALINILPFPALDGGHILVLAVEGIIRREIPHKIKIGIQQAGFVALLVFMAFVLYNDITSF
jgi:regulator of sigma E protease